MKMSRIAWIRVVTAAVVVLAALLFIRLHNASAATLLPDSASPGHRLADAWCKQCHAIDAGTAGASNPAPDFAAIASQPSTTALSLKVFLKTSHRSMPNLVIAPDQADDLVDYILSLKRN
jgi:mono/diheme cytochrome c family protein